MKSNQWNPCNQLSVLVDAQNVPLADTTPVSGILSMLKPHHNVVRVPHHDDIPVSVPRPPRLNVVRGTF